MLDREPRLVCHTEIKDGTSLIFHASVIAELAPRLVMWKL